MKTKTVKTVEEKIAANLPQAFGLMLDGWTDTATSSHYLGIFAIYYSEARKMPLLGFSPLIDETWKNAENHIEFILFVLGIFQKNISDVKFLVCDNENLNQCISRKLSIPMIGCNSHRLNPAVKSMIMEYYSIEIDLINKLMVKMTTDSMLGYDVG